MLTDWDLVRALARAYYALPLIDGLSHPEALQWRQTKRHPSPGRIFQSWVCSPPQRSLGECLSQDGIRRTAEFGGETEHPSGMKMAPIGILGGLIGVCATRITPASQVRIGSGPVSAG